MIYLMGYLNNIYLTRTQLGTADLFFIAHWKYCNMQYKIKIKTNAYNDFFWIFKLFSYIY